MKKYLLIALCITVTASLGCSEKKSKEPKEDSSKKSAVASNEPAKDGRVYARVIGYSERRVVVNYNNMNTFTNISTELPYGSRVYGTEDKLGNFKGPK